MPLCKYIYFTVMGFDDERIDIILRDNLFPITCRTCIKNVALSFANAS